MTGGFRQLLLSRSEEPTPHTVRSMVPVSTRPPGAEGIPDNRVSMMLLFLPVDLAEPEGWLRVVQERVCAHRDGGEPQAGAALFTLAEYEPFLPVSMGVRLGFHFPQRSISAVTTNVPGPRSTLYGLGCELDEILPFVPIGNRVRISVAIFSYRDTVTFGITGDYTSVPDVEVLARGISASLADLVDLAARPAEKVT